MICPKTNKEGDKMKKILLILIIGSLFASETQTVDVINITKESKVEVYTALF